MPKPTSYSERARLRLSRTEGFYRSFVKAYPKSGLSISAYCRTHHVGESTFQKYRKALVPKDPAPPPAPQGHFLPVRIASTCPPPAHAVEVHFPTGVLLRLPELTASHVSALSPVLLGRDA